MGWSMKAVPQSAVCTFAREGAVLFAEGALVAY